MVVRYGRTVPRGFLPVFSVDTEEEAEQLLLLTCSTNAADEYIAFELAMAGEDRTLEMLRAFGDKLAAAYEVMRSGRSSRRRP